MNRGRPGPDEVPSITTARPGRSRDLDRRMTRYLTSMAIRTVCFVLVVLVHSPWRWAFAVAAVFLPYAAVIMANTGHNRRTVWPVPSADPAPGPVAMDPERDVVTPPQ